MSGMPTRSVCKGRCESRPRLKDWVSTGMGGGGKSISHIQRTPPRPPLHRPHTIKTPSYVWPLLPLPSPCFYHLRRPKLTSMTFSILAPSSPPFKQIPSPHFTSCPRRLYLCTQITAYWRYPLCTSMYPRAQVLLTSTPPCTTPIRAARPSRALTNLMPTATPCIHAPSPSQVLPRLLLV